MKRGEFLIEDTQDIQTIDDQLRAAARDGGQPPLSAPSEEVLVAEGPSRERRTAAEGSAEIKTWVFRADREPHPFPLAELSEIIDDDANLAWIDLGNYTRQNLRHLAPILDLADAEVHAALSPWQRPRLDIYGDHFFVSVTVARLDTRAHRVLAGELDLCVGRNFLLSLHKLPIPFKDAILARARQSPELVRLDSAYMLYIILDELLAHYEALYEHIQGEQEHMEERALTNTSDDFLEDLVDFKRYVTALTRVAEQHRQVFAAFVRPDFRFVSGEGAEMYFRDLETRLGRLIDTLDTAREAANGAFDIYISQMSHRTNQIIKVLTIVSTVLLPISVIIVFFGTSFRGVPIYGKPDFLVMLALIVATTGGIVYAFRRRGWL